MKKISIVAAFLSAFSLSCVAQFEQNFFNANFRSHAHRFKKHEFVIVPTVSLWDHGRNGQGNKVDSLQYLHSTQNAFAMLKGFTHGSNPEQIVQQFTNDEDGTRGHFVVTGDYEYKQLAGEYMYHFDHEWSVSAYVPYYVAHVKHVSWKDQTKSLTFDDILMHSLVTDNLASNVTSLGDLNLGDWSKNAFGDIRLLGHWNRLFLQEKEWLKAVGVSARLGITLPTGYRKNEDIACGFAFGNDGALAVPFGCGLDVKFKKFAHAGIDVCFEHIFNDTKERRIMTDPLQTDLLLLQKASTYKEHGMVQMFNLYVEPQLFDHVAFRCAYQHIKKGADKLYVIDNDYSSIVANKAASLKEWTTHNLFMQVRYDNEGTRGAISPIVSVFAQVPFNGKRSLQAAACGFSVAVHF